MKRMIPILLALILCQALCTKSLSEEAPEYLLDVLWAPSCAIETDTGALLVTDVLNKCIWLVESGHAGRFAGGESEVDRYEKPMGGFSDGDLASSLFMEPWAIAPFLDGWAVSDTGNSVLRMVTLKEVRTINGHTSDPTIRVSDTGVVYDRPTGLAADEGGNLYVSNTETGRIYQIHPDGSVIVFFDQLKEPTGLCWQGGALYVAETGAHRIVKIEGGKLQAVAGSGEEGFIDGPAEEARFSWPCGVFADKEGAVYVADTANSSVRRIQNGKVDTLLQRGSGTDESFPFSPRSLLILNDGELLICDPYARMIRIQKP